MKNKDYLVFFITKKIIQKVFVIFLKQYFIIQFCIFFKPLQLKYFFYKIKILKDYTLLIFNYITDYNPFSSKKKQIKKILIFIN